MMRLSRLSLIAAAASFALSPLAGSAQAACAFGHAANGDCVNETMATAAITAAVIFSQPKISFSAYPILPQRDLLLRYPHELNPTQFPPTRVGPGPAPVVSGGGAGGAGGGGAGGGGGTGGGGGAGGGGAGGGGTTPD